VSPILGIIASQNYPRITSSYESIATVNITTNTATIDFTSIPATYTHLQVRFIGKSSSTDPGGSNVTFNFNSDTTQSNYRSHWLTGDGASASASNLQGSGYYIYASSILTNNGSQASMFTAGVIDILDYANTNKYKTTRSLAGDSDNSTNGLMRLLSGLWISTSAITNITFTLADASNFRQYSQFALYGIKGA
jgi:hypothetical protein